MIVDLVLGKNAIKWRLNEVDTYFLFCSKPSKNGRNSANGYLDMIMEMKKRHIFLCWVGKFEKLDDRETPR